LLRKRFIGIGEPRPTLIVPFMTLKQWMRDTVGDRRVRQIKAFRTRIACKFEVGPWRRPGLNGLDVRLAEALGWQQGGTFIELGGNDGLQQSNSFLLERELGWRGILIEGVPELAAEAAHNRSKATVVCAAVTGSSKSSVVAMNNEDLVSTVSSATGQLCVATTTLSAVIDVILKGHAPDLISIDVEGFEMDVLSGLDLTRHRPRWILIETKKRDEVSNVLINYAIAAQLSGHDYLFEYGD
ncbi:FkbM family methyltransferase, partial [Mycolicibacterium elephantis]